MPKKENFQKEVPESVATLREILSFDLTQRLMGRVLTLIDASLPESKQTESLKDLIRQEIYAVDNDIWKYLFDFAEANTVTPR